MGKRKTAPPVRFAGPSSTKLIEKFYERLLLKYQNDWRRLVQEELSKVLPELRREAKEEKPEVKLDAEWSVLLSQAIRRAQERLSQLYPDQTLQKWALMLTSRIEKTTTTDITRNLKQIGEVRMDAPQLGVEVLYPNRRIIRKLTPFYQNVIDQQVALIKTISEDQATKLKSGLLQLLVENRPNREITKLLMSQFGMSKNRARLIARDQVLKLNGSVNKAKQKALGIEKYIWRTVKDERVRSRHKSLDGKEFSWDDPPVTDATGKRNHPGQDYQCRCYAEAVLDDFLK